MNQQKKLRIARGGVLTGACALTLAGALFAGIFIPNANYSDSAEGSGTQDTTGSDIFENEAPVAKNMNTVIPSATPTTVLGTFAEGSKFFYTNYETGIAISDGKSNAATDMEVVTVTDKAANAAGTKLNPYVINSKSDWNVFATQISKTFGAGQYFVLNNDLDYNTAAEGQPVARSAIARVETFKGTLYGNGHTIKNITYAKSSATAGVDGLFTHIQNATICDLGIQNYYCNNNNNKFGALAGHSRGNNYIANCKSQGAAVVNASAVQSPTNMCCSYGSAWYTIGGLVGHACGSNSEIIYFYKCATSSDFTATMPTAHRYSAVGGIAGHVYSINTRVYDCFAYIKASYSGYTHSGGITGGIQVSGKLNIVKNAVCIANLTNNELNYWDTGVTPLYNGDGALLITNLYSYGNFNSSKGLYATKKETGTVNVTSGTLHTTSDFASYTGGMTNTSWSSPAVANSETLMTTANFWTALKDTTKNGLNPKIWNASVFDGATMSPTKPVDVFAVTPQISKTRIEFKNTDGTNCALAESTSSEAVYDQTQVGTKLPVPTSQTGKEFAGWSLFSDNDATTYKVFPEKLFGNVTMYPVYNMTGVKVTTKFDMAESNGSVSGSNVTAKYIGEGVVTLKATATAPVDLADCTLTWSWFKNEGGNETKLEGETEDTLVLTELTSATYYAKVNISKDGEMWRTKPQNDVKSNEFNITIKKGELAPNGGITLKSTVGEEGNEKDVYAYWGQSLNELTDLVAANMQNTAGIAVAGTISWVPLEDGSVDNVKDAQQTYAALFHPADTARYEDNTPINVTITPTVLQRIYEFKINEQVTKSFTFPERYGAVYTKGQIADQFEEAYFDWLNELSSGNTYDAIVGRMPYFDGVDILQYRQSSDPAAYFDGEHVADDSYIVKDRAANTAVLNIPVVFNSYQQSTKFTVSLFKTEMSGNLETTTQSLGYGATVAKPEKTLHVAGGKTYFLTNWYVSDTSGNYPTEEVNGQTRPTDKAVVWDFTGDRIKGATNLAADWMEGFLKLTSIEATVNGSNKTFTARSLPKSSDYVVVGTYTVYASEDAAKNDNPQIVDGKPQTVALTLSPDDYTVTGKGSGGMYHVHVKDGASSWDYAEGKNDRVTVAAKVSGVSSIDLDVAVNQLRVDLSKVNFPNQSVAEVSGLKQKISAAEIDEQDFENQKISADEYTLVYEYWSSGDVLLNENEGVSAKGTYYVRLRFDFSSADLIADKISATFTITEKPIEVYVKWNADNQKEYKYNGQVQHPEASFYRKDNDAPVTITFVYTGNFEQKNANADGVYSRVGVSLRNSRYVLTEDAGDTIEFRINRAKVPVPKLSNNSFEYKASDYDISQYIGYDTETLTYLVEVRNGIVKDVPSAGSITSNVYLRDTVNSEWEDGTNTVKPVVWTITPKVMTVPTFTETLVYSGEKYKIAEHLNFFDPVITVFGAETEASNAGIYRANLKLPTENGGKNYVWDSADFNGTVDWRIQKKELYLNWESWNYLYNGQTHAPRAKISFGLVEADASLINSQNQFIYTGDSEKREPGSYKMEVTIAQNADIYANYVIAKDSSTFYWVIKENANEVIITVVWDIPSDGGYTFNDQIQAPKVKALYSENGMGEANLDDYEITYTGDYNKSKWRGSYTVGVEIKAYDGTPIRVRQGECSYVIRPNQGEGNPPVDPIDPIDPDNKGDNPSEGTVWLSPQTIISAISLVLLIVFTIMTLNYVSVMNDAKKKTKKLAQISYSFAPAGLLALAFGLSSGAWWGVAATLAALAILMCAMMFLYRSKSRKALAALAEEQERVDEEKEAAREAQQQRRDDEFKMMFAAMQQNYQQPQVGYEDMQNMISSAVTALLPTMQQQMQALPPAQSENDELRAMMEQQQEMLNQLMQNQQAQQSYAQPVQEESVRTVFDTQPETEVVTLEESYGNLSDDEKRFYYEIGGYIMSKPDTVQNDGKYAVLFKYRGRTLFKLFIKNNAPVLAYALDNDSQAEMLIDDETALDDAKQIVNMRMKRVDREMDR